MGVSCAANCGIGAPCIRSDMLHPPGRKAWFPGAEPGSRILDCGWIRYAVLDSRESYMLSRLLITGVVTHGLNRELLACF